MKIFDKSKMNVYSYSYSMGAAISSNKNNKVIAFGISPLSTKKQASDLDRYGKSMNSSVVDKDIDFFIKSLKFINSSDSKIVLDVGSSIGTLGRNIVKHYPAVHVINFDVNNSVLENANKINVENGFINSMSYMVGNALDLPVNRNSLDAITMSRVMHEIFSYDNPKSNADFSVISVYEFFKNAYEKLKPGGRIIIQDPAKPKDYNSLVKIVNISKFNKEQKKSADLKDIKNFSTFELLQEFLTNFKPAKGQYLFAGNSCTMPKWLASEFIRHRKFNDTIYHWQDELNEQYGTVIPSEFKKIVKSLNYSIITCYNKWLRNKNNSYAFSENDFIITNLFGEKLSQQMSFPSKFFAIIEKR